MIKIFGEIHSSKNSRQIHVNRKTGRHFVAKSTAAKDDEQNLAKQLSDNGNRIEWERMFTKNSGISGTPISPLRVHFFFIRKTWARWDFANLVQGIADAMVKAGYLPDDDVENFIPVYAGYKVDKQNPGVEFWIE